MAWWIPILQAVGINAAKNVVTGQDPLKGSVEAGVTGGVLGGFNTGGGLFGSNPLASSAAPTTQGAFEASMGLSNAYNAGSLAGLPSSGTIESIMGQAGADGVYRDAGSFTNVFGTPTYTGGEGLLSNAASNIGDTLSGAGQYVTPQNLVGASNLLARMNQSQPISSSGGGVRGGGAVKFEPFATGQVYTRKKRG